MSRNKLYEAPGLSTVARKGLIWGDTIRWTPSGWASVAADDPNEPLTINSPLGWRGSKKYPFGRPWPEWFGFDGISDQKLPILGILLLIGLLWMLLRSKVV